MDEKPQQLEPKAIRIELRTHDNVMVHRDWLPPDLDSFPDVIVYGVLIYINADELTWDKEFARQVHVYKEANVYPLTPIERLADSPQAGSQAE